MPRNQCKSVKARNLHPPLLIEEDSQTPNLRQVAPDRSSLALKGCTKTPGRTEESEGSNLDPGRCVSDGYL